MADRYLITGGAGFIGSNYADYLLSAGKSVRIFDNLSRSGAEKNLAWLRTKHGPESFELSIGDLREQEKLSEVVRDVDVVAHLAGQVAVTSSVVNPREDFEINALGTFNLLEAIRLSGQRPFVLYSSTNKVYGEMLDQEIVEKKTRYAYKGLKNGVSENQGLDFHSPYGCSKGTADQYVQDYARIFDIPSVVMRQSAIYGQRQFGVEDQGWLAWFAIAAVLDKPITIYGDGKQVRDMLDVRDLVRAYELAVDKRDEIAGEVFNIGGGPKQTISIWAECGPMLEKFIGRELPVSFDQTRPGDQRVYISDIRKAKNILGWTPEIGIVDGMAEFVNWVRSNRALFS